MKTIIILGSSRKEGETSKIVNEVIDNSNWDLVDLNDYENPLQKVIQRLKTRG